MESSAGRRPIARNGTVAGSVWEARMRADAVNGGVKVFTGNKSPDGDGVDHGDANADEEGMRVYRRLRRNQSDIIAASRKRRIWTPPQLPPPSSLSPSVSVSAVFEGSPIQLGKARSELSGDSAVRVLAIRDGSVGFDGDKGESKNGNDVGRKSFDDKEIDLPMEKEKSVAVEKTINRAHEIPISSTSVEKKLCFSEIVASQEAENRSDMRPIYPDAASPPPSKLGKKLNLTEIGSSPAAEKMIHSRIDPDPAETPGSSNKVMKHIISNPDPVEAPSSDRQRKVFDIASRNHGRMQRIVDLVMWKDVPKTAFVFGLATFFLISSSYANELNFSLISASSYIALIYLALTFFYKSILRRGQSVDYDERDDKYMVGEEEAIWLLRLLLPYLNELLLKMSTLFSGDPATTMKLAAVLFVMAKCGSSITIWTLSKLMFFGIFTVPKICTSYSSQLVTIGKLWLERFRDGWESCTHKKAVFAAIFTLIWNTSSIMVRIWSIFMLVVFLKFYQRCVAEDLSKQKDVVVEEAPEVFKSGQSHSPSTPHQCRVELKRNVVIKDRKHFDVDARAPRGTFQKRHEKRGEGA